jgi:hypothetical protein
MSKQTPAETTEWLVVSRLRVISRKGPGSIYPGRRQSEQREFALTYYLGTYTAGKESLKLRDDWGRSSLSSICK